MLLKQGLKTYTDFKNSNLISIWGIIFSLLIFDSKRNIRFWKLLFFYLCEFSIRVILSEIFFNQWAIKLIRGKMESKVGVNENKNNIDNCMKLFYIDYKSKQLSNRAFKSEKPFSPKNNSGGLSSSWKKLRLHTHYCRWHKTAANSK